VVTIVTEFDDDELKVWMMYWREVLANPPTLPLEALTTGTLKLGAEDHGFVAAVEVTVPDEIAIAEDSVIVPDVTDTRPLDTVTISPADDVTVAIAVLVPVILTAVDPAPAPETMVTERPPEVVTGAMPPDVPTRWTSVDPAPAPANIVTPRPPDVVTGYDAPAVEIRLT
jgi:hypothetical protein